MEKDRIFNDAVKVVFENKMASSSLLQRKLKLGYNRADRIISQLEEEGIIGKSRGTKPREVLVTEEEVNKILGIEKKEDKYVEISIHMKVDGNIINERKEKYYGRNRETSAWTLDDFARIIFMWEHIFSGHSTYAYDGLMQEMEKKLEKKDGETAESVFQKYWVNLEETINKEFDENNKGDGEIFPAENDYLKYSLEGMVVSFVRQPKPVQYGFIYWFFKHLMGGKIDELLKDVESTPKYIVDIIEEVNGFRREENDSKG